ncbi:MAG: hypothetical protein IPL27_28335 [Lewinellaceae bacterium]|nr:hypothetical protein [Lewinellaceae bacterium]
MERQEIKSDLSKRTPGPSGTTGSRAKQPDQAKSEALLSTYIKDFPP